MHPCEVWEMFALFYGLWSTRDGLVDTHGLRPRDSRDAHWRYAYAEMQREERRLTRSEDVQAPRRRGVPWRLSWPFAGQR